MLGEKLQDFFTFRMEILTNKRRVSHRCRRFEIQLQPMIHGLLSVGREKKSSDISFLLETVL
jgi:hypothetical protein